MSNNFSSKRQLSIYEKQQLIRYGLKEIDFLKTGEMPVEYFTGKVDFSDLTLNIDSSALIPRIETEEIIDLAMKKISNFKKKKTRVLDLGTGSGAIALSLIDRLVKAGYQGKKWEFYLTDSSAKALNLARKNYYELVDEAVNKNSLTINFLLSDLLCEVPKNLKFDLVLANLPYIPSHRVEGLDSSVKDFEPILALDGGENGFDLIAKVLKELLFGKFLSDDFELIFETDESHNFQFIKNNYSFILDNFEINCLKDQFARQRFLQLKNKRIRA